MPRSRLIVRLLLVALLAIPGSVADGSVTEDPRAAALAYLERHATEAAALAPYLVEVAHANGLEARAWPPASPALANVQAPPDPAADIALLRPLRAFALAGDARGWEGDLAQRAEQRRSTTGYGAEATLNDDAFLLLAHAAQARHIEVDPSRLEPMRRHLAAHQHPSGGWGWAIGAAPDSDMTGIVVAALASTGGVPPDLAANASRFLASTRSATGGFAVQPGREATCESTVWALRAQIILGDAPEAADTGFLRGLLRADGGFAHVPNGGSDLFCTLEVATLLGENPGLLPAESHVLRTPAVPAAALLTAVAVGAWHRRRTTS